MIDREIQIFNRAYPAVAPLCARNRFVSTAITEPLTAFPAASLIEIGNRTVSERQSSTPVENYALVTFQLDVFATSKSDCRKVYAAADTEMIAMNFTRTSGQYIAVPGNTKVFRYTARYEAIIDTEGNIYRR